MPSSSSLLHRYGNDSETRRHLALPIVLLLSTVFASFATAPRHSLLTSAIAWTSICTVCSLKAGVKSLLDATQWQKIAWAAGALLALAAIEEKGAGGKYGSGIWWAKGLLPLTVYAISQTKLVGADSHAINDVDAPTGSEKRNRSPADGSKTALVILSATAVAAVYVPAAFSATTSLGLSYAALTALALLLLERARLECAQVGGSVIYSANGLLSHAESSAPSAENATVLVIRDVSAAAAIGLGVAALFLEHFTWSEVIVWDHSNDGQVLLSHLLLKAVFGLGASLLHIAMDGSLLLMILRQDAFTTSFVPLYASICARLIVGPDLARAWFAGLCVSATFAYLNEQRERALLGSGSGLARMRMRFGKLLTLVALASFAVLAFLQLRQPFQRPKFRGNPPIVDNGVVVMPVKALDPMQYTNTRVHPVDQLVRDAEASWMATLGRQSKSLEAAVEEYQRRYKMPPPPHFDKWYEFAKQRNVQLIDEYDSIYHSLLPFWALKPSTIRARVREGIGFDANNLMALLVRDGQVVFTTGGQAWLMEAVPGMMKEFVEWLPDMDLAFNIHDEPRVVVPHDKLQKLVQIAVDERLPALMAKPDLKNAFSLRPPDVGKGRRVVEYKTTRFNVFAHQPTWLPSTLSCASDSPARCLDDSQCADNLTTYALSELGFIYNHTAFSDVCNSPSLSTSHGFFDRPNAFNVIHDLFPVFSQSKMSSFQDILYPSPWYWYGKVSYDEKKDKDWTSKIASLWWRGSTTGGFSRDGGWRRQHRQQFVGNLNALDTAKTLTNIHADEPEAVPEYKKKNVQRQDFKEVMDVHFSHVGQCDPGDCDAQKEFFQIVPPADQQDAWKYRYLLDIDGNAFSGRFYAFLKSKSLTFKMAVFREWHEEWLKPWVHYIPLSLRGEEALETVRYLSSEKEGKDQAIRMAESSREWANKVLRNEDFEVWFFRLMLEYGRVIDDDRENLGFAFK